MADRVCKAEYWQEESYTEKELQRSAENPPLLFSCVLMPMCVLETTSALETIPVAHTGL